MKSPFALSTLALSTVALSAALSLPAQAQTVPAIPALPAGSSVYTTQPAVYTTQPAMPSQAVSVSAPAAIPLFLSAPVGASVTYNLSNTSSISINQMHFVARAGQKVSDKELSALNSKLSAQKEQMSALFSKSANAVSSKMYVRMLPNDPQGNRVMKSTLETVVSVPVTKRVRRRNVTTMQSKTVTVSTTQTFSASGQLLRVQMESSDPTLQKVYASLDTQALLRLQGLNSLSLYSLPIAVGQSVQQTFTLDTQSLFGNVLGKLGTQESMNAQPLTMQVTINYLGNVGGYLRYQQAYTAQPWSVTTSIGEGKQTGQMKLSTENLSGQRQDSYRSDGLLQTRSEQQSFRMTMVTDIPGSPYQMEMQLDISTKSSVSPI